MRRLRRALLAIAAVALLAVAAGPLLIAVREPDDGARVPADVARRILDVGGRRVHVVERGEGPALLLVHGFGDSGDDYAAVLESFARAHRAIAVDLFGFGWSERGEGWNRGWTPLADQLAGVLDALELQQASIVGQSMGGAVAAVFAARHPSRDAPDDLVRTVEAFLHRADDGTIDP